MIEITRGILSAVAPNDDFVSMLSFDAVADDRSISGARGDRKSEIELEIGFRDFMAIEFRGWRRAMSAAIGARSVRFQNPLTPAEQQVGRLVAAGHTSREVAEILGRSVLTVESHVRSIVRKLESDNRRIAVRKAKDRGFI